MYSIAFAEVYELVYGLRGKDWAAEAEDIVELIRKYAPSVNSLLDVGCGTGAHLEKLSTILELAEGVEIAAPMREAAERRLPGTAVHAGDMRDFRLDRRFDSVMCMFNAIGYLSDEGEMRTAVRNMADHLNPGGVLVVEPWWFPDQFLDGYLAADSGTVEGRAVARVSHSTRSGRSTRLEAKYLVGGSDGITEFTQVHQLMLFTKAEYLAAFAGAGCPAEYLPGSGPNGRGLFVGVDARLE